jgi:ADP-heptose:LPS heptosyltransferase
MHVASLVGTPVVQLLGPTDPIENAPWRETPSRSLRSESGGMDIGPDEVVSAARTLLAEGGIDYHRTPEVQR